MNFEEAYRKFLDGTASDEETLYVAAEIRKAKEVDEILHLTAERPVFQEVSDDTVKKARKKLNNRTFVRTLIISLCSVAAIAAIVCGILFIPSTISARRCQNYSRQECTEIAKQQAKEYLGGRDTTEFVVRDVDRHIYLGNGLTKAVYRYEVDLKNEYCEMEIYVNARSGYAEITDIDH